MHPPITMTIHLPTRFILKKLIFVNLPFRKV